MNYNDPRQVLASSLVAFFRRIGPTIEKDNPLLSGQAYLAGYHNEGDPLRLFSTPNDSAALAAYRAGEMNRIEEEE